MDNVLELELSTSTIEVIPVDTVVAWKDLIKGYETEKRDINYGKPNNYSIHSPEELLINRGAGPCALIISLSLRDGLVGQGHFIVGGGQYPEFLSWMSGLSDLSDNEVYIFGQAFLPNPNAHTNTYIDRAELIKDLTTCSGYTQKQIKDYRESNPDRSGSDNIIADIRNKKIYYYRTKRNPD